MWKRLWMNLVFDFMDWRANAYVAHQQRELRRQQELHRRYMEAHSLSDESFAFWMKKIRMENGPLV